ncbi:endonuclease/exonuclease/phosphatase family protein [Pleomorphovibrio marinus]|uniref:endonuclease/exonuclease/phosphatase family protein n=1 Tax=Pleomorphovibrio marinus TaxID=2164132 RepID=UPI000E0A7DD3|nr:endonuclease/exonuclease/phosphatase family protein [Pleomorphovibrio marinus]
MEALEIIKWFFAALSLIAALASLIKWDDWWIRVFDFPRIQVVVINVLSILLFLGVGFTLDLINGLFLLLLIAALIYQGKKIYLYTPFAPKQVAKSSPGKKGESICTLVCNVYTPNRNSEALISLIESNNPDLVLTLESDLWWEKQLCSIEKHLPHTVKVPLDNLYGMHLYSKLPLEDVQVLYIVKEEIPSIHAKVLTPAGEKINIHCLHPEPPSPSESETSTDRDAELLIVAKNVKNHQGPVMVFGDLNDVAWSRTTLLFQKISGLLDPRIGRGFFNTFHAKYPLLRWPLDHIFFSRHFTLETLRVLPKMGSDHFPVLIRLTLHPRENLDNETEEEAQVSEKSWAAKKIDKADPNLKTI